MDSILRWPAPSRGLEGEQSRSSQSNRNNHDARTTWEFPGKRGRGPGGDCPSARSGAGHNGSVASPVVAKPPNLDRPLVRLGEVIAGLQADDPFYPVAVIVPSLFTRVQ